MPVPSAITDLSQTAGSNSPSGSESPITTDNYLRSHASFIALLNAALGNGSSVGFTQSGTGADVRTFQSKLREYVSITDFGTLGAGNDAAILQEAINAVQGTSMRLMIPGNTTVQLGTTGVTVTGALKLIGDSGRARTAITWTSTTMTAITVTCAAAVYFEGINFSGPSSCTAGGAISLSGTGGVANSFSQIKDCQFTNGYRQVYAPDAYAWEISGSYFNAPVSTGIYVGCTTDQDAGDSTIYGNVFANLGASASAIYQVGSGGLRITDNKMNGGADGYVMDLASGATTSILVFTGNSVENQTTAGVRMVNTAGGGSFSQVLIDGNQFAYQATPILLNDASVFILGACISNNVITAASGTGTTAAITCTAVPRALITGNIIYGSGTTVLGISVGSLSVDSRVSDDNLIYGCATDTSIAHTNVVASASSIALPTGFDVVQISGTTGITSIASGSAWKGKRVTLYFQGALTVTDGSNLTLAGNFTTTAGDTLTLVCYDGTNWAEESRSVN